MIRYLPFEFRENALERVLDKLGYEIIYRLEKKVIARKEPYYLTFFLEINRTRVECEENLKITRKGLKRELTIITREHRKMWENIKKEIFERV